MFFSSGSSSPAHASGHGVRRRFFLFRVLFVVVLVQPVLADVDLPVELIVFLQEFQTGSDPFSPDAVFGQLARVGYIFLHDVEVLAELGRRVRELLPAPSVELGAEPVQVLRQIDHVFRVLAHLSFATAPT